jgi:anti-sigma B factor antagonist
MEIIVRQAGTAVLASPVGSLDALTAPEVEACLQAELDRGQSRLILDLGQTDYMGSVGLRVMLSIMQQCRRKGGDLRVAAAQPGVAKVLRMSGAGEVLKIFATAGEAVASYGAAASS